MFLLVAATEPELCGHGGLVCGVGPVEAAASTARALASGSFEAVIHVGVAGGPTPGSLVIGSEARYLDLSTQWPVVDVVEPDAGLLSVVRVALPDADVMPIATSGAVGRACNDQLQGVPSVEAMEGFGVLRAAALAGVAAVEVRAISNVVGEPDRSRWRVDEALALLEASLPVMVEAVRADLRARAR